MNGITKETFLAVKGDERDAILYDMLENIYRDLQTVQRKSWLDKGFLVAVVAFFTAAASWIKG